ncbi:MAG: hypothetical protein QXI12_10645 [Candidatus Methanomethyliaceae archaeon]
MLEPKYCPFCGAPVVSDIPDGFLEIGEWDGSSYAFEDYVIGYRCQGPEPHGFYVLPGGKVITDKDIERG